MSYKDRMFLEKSLETVINNVNVVFRFVSGEGQGRFYSNFLLEIKHWRNLIE